MPRIAVTAPLVSSWIEAIWAVMSWVALAVWVARFLTSHATTAKPLPCSPARAASIVALSASRLVWPAMLEISSTTSLIFCAASAKPWTVASVCSAWLTASLAMPVERLT